MPSRASQLASFAAAGPDWDLVVIGGGATGVGVALDAAARGYRVVLLEQHDFGKGTSSRSTKLVHGGVRYLQQGQLKLVSEALRERGRLIANAPHLVYPLPTIIPLYRWWAGPYYRLGIALYDWFAGRHRLGRSRWLSRSATIDRLPTINPLGLRGGVLYHDAGFNDSRLLINMVQTATERGAICLNYATVVSLAPPANRFRKVGFLERETGRQFEVTARVVVNATGPFADSIRRLEDDAVQDWIAASQGTHIVLARRFLPGDAALIVPRTPDGRVVFAIPWQGRTLVGTTDNPRADIPLEPQPQPEEIDFLLETVSAYLSPPPTRADVLSAFAGIRPLVQQDDSPTTSKLSRSHAVRVSSQGLVSILGGKWTTYREMAEDTVAKAIEVGNLPPRPCPTPELMLHGGGATHPQSPFAEYGSDTPVLERLIHSNAAYQERLDANLPHVAGQVIWAARHEFACTVEDVLARRLRALFLDARAANRAAPQVAQLLAEELDRDHPWQQAQIESFRSLAGSYAGGANVGL